MNLKDLFVYDPKSDQSGQQANEYYQKAAAFFALFRKISYFLILLVILFFSLTNLKSLSFNSFYYLSKDFSLAASYLSSGQRTVSYPATEAQSFALYHGGIAVAGREGVSVISTGGNDSFFESHKYGNPIVKTSSKYILIYDNGGKSFSLYNSFTKVKSEVTKHAIYGADVTDNGTYALLTTSDDYVSVVKIVNSKGTEYTYNFKDTVTAIDLSSDGKRLVVSLSTPLGNIFITEIKTYKVGDADAVDIYECENGVPIKLGFFENENVLAVFSNSVKILSKGLKLKEELVPENNITKYYLTNDYATVVFKDKKTTKDRVVIFDSNGNVSYNEAINKEVQGVSTYGDSLFVQALDEILKIDINRPSRVLTQSCSSLDAKMLVIDENTVLICSNSHANYINFDK